MRMAPSKGSDAEGTPPPRGPGRADAPAIRSVLTSLVIDGLLPFVTYVLLTSYAPRLSQVLALYLPMTVAPRRSRADIHVRMMKARSMLSS